MTQGSSGFQPQDRAHRRRGARRHRRGRRPGAPPRRPTPPAARPRAWRPAAAPSKIFQVTDTATGKVQGIANGPIWEFRGIPYGAPTGGKNRFMPPQKPAPWKGVRECFAYTSVCPQTQADIRGEYGQLIMWDRQVGGMGEDCLSLNVWTTSVDRSAKKAVMVSFHGGGFATGSGNAPGFDGKNLAYYGDVVVVTREPPPGELRLHRTWSGAGAPEAFEYAGVGGRRWTWSPRCSGCATTSRTSAATRAG